VDKIKIKKKKMANESGCTIRIEKQKLGPKRTAKEEPKGRGQ